MSANDLLSRRADAHSPRIVVALSAVCLSLWQAFWRRPPRQKAWLVYVACELYSYWRFRVRMALLQLPRKVYRRGTHSDLQWVLQSVKHPVCPITMNAQGLQRYLDESPGKKAKAAWEHYYVMVQDALCIAGPSPEEHAVLVQIASEYAKREGVSEPPTKAKPPSCRVPVSYGGGTLQVFHKPLPLEAALKFMRIAGNMLFTMMGYKGYWLPTPEGWIRYWVAMPLVPECEDLLPAVFIHGVGLGALPYIVFLQRLRRGRGAPLVVVELPNCSRTHFQTMILSAASFRDAIERLLRAEFGISKPGQYLLLGHSLGTDFCSFIMNDPRMAHADPAVRPARLVLMDPVCFAQEIADSHRLPFWSVREAIGKAPTGWRVPIELSVLFCIIRDEYNQEATKRAIVPGTDSLFRCSRSLLQRCPTLVCVSGNDQALPAWKIHDYVRSQFPDIAVRLDPGLEHGGFLMPFVPGWMARQHADDVMEFLDGGAQTSLPRSASHAEKVDARKGEDAPMRRNSRSELALSKQGR